MALDRFELKYWVQHEHIPALVRQIAPFTRLDPCANAKEGPEQGYWVNSLYFDNMMLGAYQEKLAGIQERSKLRLRTYGGVDVAPNLFLEVKQKSGMTIRKHRLALAPDYLNQAPQKGWVQELRRVCFDHETEAIPAVQRMVQMPNIRPVVLVLYRRVPYVAIGAEKVRITFDHSVSARRATDLLSTSAGRPLRPTHGQGVILEVKFSGPMPCWLQSFVVRNELVRESISKYALGMEAVSPLSENRRHQAFVDEGLDDLAISLLGRSPHVSKYP